MGINDDVFITTCVNAEKNEYVRNFFKSISFRITDEVSSQYMEITFVLCLA